MVIAVLLLLQTECGKNHLHDDCPEGRGLVVVPVLISEHEEETHHSYYYILHGLEDESKFHDKTDDVPHCAIPFVWPMLLVTNEFLPTWVGGASHPSRTTMILTTTVHSADDDAA